MGVGGLGFGVKRNKEGSLKERRKEGDPKGHP